MITFKRLARFGKSGFGNQLFNYAVTRLYAENNKFNYSFPTWDGNKVFKNITSYTPLERMGSWFLPTYQLDDLRSYNKADKIKYMIGIKKHLLELHSTEELFSNPKNNISIFGYQQDKYSLNLLNIHKKRILDWFTFKDEIENYYKELTKKFDPWIGVHIRRGDFVKIGVDFPLEKITNFIQQIRNNRNIFISTNEPELISKLAYLNPINPGIKNNQLEGMPGYLFDFWMLKNSQTIIGCGSTFSWWAGFLSNKNAYYSPPLTHLWKKGEKPEIMKIEI